MKIINQKLVAALLVVSALTVSCEKEDEKALSPAEAKKTMNSLDAQLSSDLDAFANAEGMAAIQDLAGLAGEGNLFEGRFSSNKRDIKKNLKASLATFRSIFTPADGAARTKDDEPFNYTESLGVYEWNKNLGIWVRTGNSNIIQLFFPTKNANGTFNSENNAEFKLTAYAEVATPNGDDDYSPTLINAVLNINKTKSASLDLAAEYGTDDEPIFADITYFVAPFSFEIDLDEKKSTSSSFSETLLKDNEVVLGAGITATYKSASKEEDNLKTITGYVQLINAKFEGTIDVANANSINSSGDINDYIKVVLTIDGSAAGNLIWVNEEPHVEYADGSKESLEDIFELLEESLQDFDDLV